jgi:DNA-binding winged helix-turn-helix (wHTH) protein
MKEFTPFRLDPVNQCLWRRTGEGDYERILLTPTEFGVLDHLVERAGQLVTHRELLDAVWPRTAIEPQAVKSKIFHLRRTLDDDPKKPRFIETLPRRGYRFVGKLEAEVADEGHPSPPPAGLVGREGALAELWQCAASAAAGAPQVVFVTGEPGIGKTALVEEFQRQVARRVRAIRVARGHCVEGFGSKEAFYPVLDALGQLCRGPEGGRVVEILALHAPTWLVQFPALLTRQHRETLRHELLGATRERMLREGCEALEAIAAAAPLLLVLEDLHWTDSSTLDLVSVLARRRVRARILLIATYRPSDVAHSAQPLHALKRDLVARQFCREIALEPLTPADIASYLSGGGAAPGAPDELTVLLHTHTEGNPLFMHAVLQQLAERGLVERSDGGWELRRAAASISLEVPDSVRQMIGAQIDRLEVSDQRVLEVAAIAGMSFAPAISAPAGDLDIGEIERCCDALARRDHIVRRAGIKELPDGRIVQRYEFVHALYREVLYERQGPARRAMLHRRWGEWLEQIFADARDQVAPELAHHFERGSDWARAVTYLRLAARGAAARCSLEDARANLQRALALAAKLALPERAAAETEILDALADMSLGSFDPGALSFLTSLRERAAEYGLADVEAKALIDQTYPIAWESSEQGLEVIVQALRLGETQQDPLRRARIRARCMMRRIWIRGWNADDAAVCRRELAKVRRLGGPLEAAWHVIDCNLLDFFSSEYRKAMRDAVECLGTLTQGRELFAGYAHSVRELTVPWSLILLGEWGEALHELDGGIAAAEKNADSHRRQTLLLLRSLALLHAGDFAGARAICNSLMGPFQQPARAPWRRFCLSIGGAADAGLGDYAGALERFRRAREEMGRQPALGDWYWRLVQGWALADLWLSRGDLARAREAAGVFAAEAAVSAERTWQGLAWEAQARVALAADEPRRAQAHVGQALAALDGFEVPLAGWQVHATAADVCRARGETVAARRHQETSRGIVRRLAASLDGYGDLQRAFLTAPAVANVLGEPVL